MEEAFSEILDNILLFLPKLGASLLILLVFWIASGVAKQIILKFANRSNLNIDVLHLLERIATISILLFGIVTALGTIGIDVSALVAGLGLTGFAFGFALRDVLSNLLAGVLILVYKPFHRHDRINVAGVEGEVIQIDLRYTTLQAEGQKILIPNSSLFTNTICIIETEPKSPLT